MRHGYVHTAVNHDMHLTPTEHSWYADATWHGSGPWTLLNFYPANTYEGNGVFTFAKVPGEVNKHQSMVFKIHYIGESFINQHIGIDIEMLDGSFNQYPTAPYYPANCLVSASIYFSPAYGLVDHTLPFNGYTGLNIATISGSSVFNTYGGLSLEEAIICPGNAGVEEYWKMNNLSRHEINLNYPTSSGYALNPDPPLGMTWLKDHDYWFVFSILYDLMYSDSAKFQIHRIYRQSPDPDPGSSPPVYTQTDIFPTPKGW
jgi:hypothetical protein